MAAREQSTTARRSGIQRSGQLALWGGILFSLAFTGLIWWAGQRLQSIYHLPDQGPSWYYWKLPEPTLWTRVTAWGSYALHQIAAWALIYYAQRRVKRYTSGLHRINVVALAGNAFFILLHFIQTHVWYDGLAQDVSIWSSQASVVLLLVLVLLMENPRRGLFFGKKVPISRRIVGLVRKYHGYVFAWATVYTLWYHPMEPTSGHLIGFFYMFLLMLQGSLIFTRVHVNRWWTLVQEVMVLFHGTLVAVMQGNNLWPMFAFGFGGIFVITQMHGLGWSRRTKGLALALYVVLALGVYSQRGWVQLNEIVRIPFIEYALVFVLAGLIGAGLWLARRLKGEQVHDTQATRT
ncbi:MAG: hypothetical protein JSV36_11775 [Anaerolineae bacterium]|nr:MAG: hypothetical protein JSV36_11775 [Anaerolineae bacterium]